MKHCDSGMSNKYKNNLNSIKFPYLIGARWMVQEAYGDGDTCRIAKKLEAHAVSASIVFCRRGELAEDWRPVRAAAMAVHWVAFAESGVRAARADDKASRVLAGALDG